jgi:hypothetical protein
MKVEANKWLESAGDVSGLDVETLRTLRRPSFGRVVREALRAPRGT